MEKLIALVTGGSRGIGAATCRALARDGYKVLIHYNASYREAELLAKEIDGEIFKADLQNDAEIIEMFHSIGTKYKKLDVLVNNAGIVECESFAQITKESFSRMIQVNLWAGILCAQQAERMIPKGSIIFISSVCARKPTSDAVVYAISKAGLESAVLSLANDLAPRIRVNAVAPAATGGGMKNASHTADDTRWIEDNYPMKRQLDPQDIGEMVCFLASDKAKNVTGQTFAVDSGASLVKG